MLRERVFSIGMFQYWLRSSRAAAGEYRARRHDQVLQWHSHHTWSRTEAGRHQRGTQQPGWRPSTATVDEGRVLVL